MRNHVRGEEKESLSIGKLRNGFPRDCLFLNGEGEIMMIEYGKVGFKRSGLNSDNRKANREIVKHYNEKNGISQEQVNRMHQEALLGWKGKIESYTTSQQKASAKNRVVFRLEVACLRDSGEDVSIILDLPATRYELEDALDKLGTPDGDMGYAVLIINGDQEYLADNVDNRANLYEMNYLSQMLASLSQWELDCFEGMVKMERVKNGDGPIVLERLINFAQSTGGCQVIYEAKDGYSLGKFYVDNDFIAELDGLPEKIFSWLDYAKVGREMRESEGGVYIPDGYVVQDEEIVLSYKAGDAIPSKEPDYGILLQIENQDSSHSKQMNEQVTLLRLPASDEELFQAIENVGADSPEECHFSVVDSMVPHLAEKIGDALYESEGDAYGLVNELARTFQQVKSRGELITYKAVIETASKGIDLEEAIELSQKIKEFSLIREASDPAVYGCLSLLTNGVEYKEDLFDTTNLSEYGKALIKKKGIVLTSYGGVQSLTGQSVEQWVGTFAQQEGMEMT